MRYCKLILFLLILPLLATGQTCKVAILSVNDIHAEYQRLPNLKTLADSLRGVYPDFLLLSAGDNRTGNPFSDFNETPSLPVTELMNMAGFDASAVGNHEFDYSSFEEFKNIMELSDFPYLMANGYAADSLNWKFEPYRIFRTHSGVKVAVTGLIQVSPDGIPDALPSNLKGFSFSDPLQRARDFYFLRDSCNIFIYLTHIGSNADTLLARQSAGVADLIVGGHSHILIKDGADIDGVLVTQAEKYLNYATLTVFDIDNGIITGRSCKTFDLSKYAPDPDAKTMAALFTANERFKQKVTDFNKSLIGTKPIGEMMADAIRETTGADIAVQNAGGVRLDSILSGVFTVADIYRLEPFGDKVVIYELTPSETEALLKACKKADRDRAPLTSGYKKGKLKRNRYYKVAVSSYIAETADFKHKKEPVWTDLRVSDLIFDYLVKYDEGYSAVH